MIVDIIIVIALVPSQYYYQATADNALVFMDNADISNQLYAADVAVIPINSCTNTNTDTIHITCICCRCCNTWSSSKSHVYRHPTVCTTTTNVPTAITTI